MDVFKLRQKVIGDYAAYTKSFIRISDERIGKEVQREISEGLLWPEPLLQLNPSFAPGEKIDDLVSEGVLHEDCRRIFRLKKNDNDFGRALRLHRHQEQAIRLANANQSYVLTTGTGSGKSLAYIIPAVDHVLRTGSGTGIKAIVVYPMNALANSQHVELDKFLTRGFEGREPLVSFARYTGQEGEQERERILNHPPDILLTNYVMMELILTRIEERRLVEHAGKLRFLVFDELHTYRGRQGADVAMLIRRCREAFQSDALRCVGTSATMTSIGDTREQTEVVSDVATRVFGENIPPENIVGETLRRSTKEYDFATASLLAKLKECVESDSEPDPDYDRFRELALASWIEDTFGLKREEETDRLIRQTPQPLKGEHGAAVKLAEGTGCSVPDCEAAIQRYLYAGTKCQDPETEYPPLFAFRLHQFITRGDTVWASLESEDLRVITLRGQQYVPGDRNKILIPIVFCRQCGQPYYRIDRPTHGQPGPVVSREEFSLTVSENVESGYLYVSSENPWPEDAESWIDRVPEDWVEVRRNHRAIKRDKPVPELIRIGTDGEQKPDGLQAAFVKAPFQFCLNPECGIAYSARQRSDVGKLSTIGVDGRSTATTILALSTILKLRIDESLEPEAKKLLSFTDNRQDASLQAGHFNDFVEVGLIRSGLYRAMARLGGQGIHYDELVHHVERALDLPSYLYANDPELRGPALEETRRALRSVLGYFLYRDLERGWRVTSPNLEQCGLLEFEYMAIDEVAGDQSTWEDKNAHAALIAATPEQRKNVIRVLLEHLRRSLAVKEDSLNPNYQERICDQSRQRLRDPWIIEDAGDMIRAGIAWPRSRMERGEQPADIFISPRSNFGQFLGRPGMLPDLGGHLSLEDKDEIILSLFRCLKPWGLVEEVRSPREGSQIPGYQIPSSVMIWKAGDGSRQMVDPLRITRQAEADLKGNEYFIELYKSFADLGSGLEGREHTAQVQADIRQEREKDFSSANLPILFCSPTMELGVDIAQLNVVNMRNVPPTPANYAQRSGRAGRGGQPAFVYTYCSGFSPHDQYYFKRPERMVSGSVTAPRLDLLNRDLVETHVHAIWLSEAKLNLGTTLAEKVLIVTEDDLSIPLKDEVKEKLADASAKLRAHKRACRFLESVGPELQEAAWYRDDWLDDVLTRLPQRFDEACNRWRSLYRAAVQQRQLQNRIIGDHSRQQSDRDRAKRLRAQAESQITLLTNPRNASEGDFYSYRYFASEGFLPGYNFPRLPLSAFIPARRGRRGKDEFLSRPRFLAIAEYGPRAVIYHEGSRYRINKVNLAFDEETQELTEHTMKVCATCGYGHEVRGPVDNCKNCGRALEPTDEIREMVRLQNVTAKRAERITSDEEERQRVGYEIRTTFSFATVNGEPDFRKAEVKVADRPIATMRYGDAAMIWRINVGWRRRHHQQEHGFLLDVEHGYWATNAAAEDGDREDPMSQTRVKRVVPFVQDSRNALAFELETAQDVKVMATLQAALKQGIQQIYQLEPNELAVDPLPNVDERRILFFYEASEGGAGVLRQVAEDPTAIAEIARVALETCHFNPETGEDLGTDKCAAACYDCLLAYGNQPDHRHIDRQLVLNLLRDLSQATTEISGSGRTRIDHLDELTRKCDSQLERRWLKQVHESQLRLPSHAQYLISACSTRPDFYYSDANTAVYIDGPPHDDPDQKAKDEQITNSLISAGYLVIRFHHAADWNKIFDQYADVFGQRKGA